MAAAMPISTRPKTMLRGNRTACSRNFAGAITPGMRAATINAPTAVETIASLLMEYRIAVQRRSGGALNFDRQQFARVPVTAVEHNDVVGPRAAGHAFATFLTTAFDKNLDGLS